MTDRTKRESMKVGSLCTGVGGLEQGLGGELCWVSEIDKAASIVLAARYPGVPNLGDLKLVDWSNVEPVDIMCFGSPCQDLSGAGKRAGLDGKKSRVFWDCIAAVCQVRPHHVFWENVAGARKHLPQVLGAFSQAGYDARWTSLRASDVGAPHRRERIFLLATSRDTSPAYPSSQGQRSRSAGEEVHKPEEIQRFARFCSMDRERNESCADTDLSTPAYPLREQLQRRRIGRNMDCEGSETQGEARKREWGRDTIANCCETAADAEDDGFNWGWPARRRRNGSSDDDFFIADLGAV